MCKVYSKTSSITLQVISIEYFIKQFKKFSHGNSADLKEYVSARKVMAVLKFRRYQYIYDSRQCFFLYPLGYKFIPRDLNVFLYPQIFFYTPKNTLGFLEKKKKRNRLKNDILLALMMLAKYDDFEVDLTL